MSLAVRLSSFNPRLTNSGTFVLINARFAKQPAALSEGFGAISVDRSSRATTQLPDLQQAKVILLAWARVKSEHGYHLVRKKKID